MKRFVLGFASLIAFWAVTSSAEVERTIAVVGSAHSVVSPDRVIWKLRIVAKDPDLQKAKQLSDRQLTALVEAVRGLMIEPGDFEIGRVRIDKVHKMDENYNEREFRYFSLQRTIIVRENDLDRFDEYLNALVVGTDIVAEMKYEVTDLDSITDGLKLEALQNAKVKAEALAATVGATLGRPIVISEYKPAASVREINEDQALARQSGIAESQFVVPEKAVIFVQIYATFELN